jgi:ABC-type branched-subunit amino acid transport system substrate-binding protein
MDGRGDVGVDNEEEEDISMKPPMKRTLAAVVIALLCLAGVTACGGGSSSSSGGSSEGTSTSQSGGSPSGGAGTSQIDSSKPPVHFALVGIQIPKYDALGNIEAGAEAAVSKINSEGGFGGREVTIGSCNSMLQPAVVTTCAHKTLAEKPVAMFGCDLAWGAAGLPIYAKAEVPSFSCLNSEADFTNPWSFGLQPGVFGTEAAAARFLCNRSDVHSVVLFTQDLPQYRETAPESLGPIFKECGKTIHYVYYPLEASDLTASVHQAVEYNPDFVITLGGGAQDVQFVQLFEQSGIPAEHIIGSSNSFAYEETLGPGGSVMEGTYSTQELASWGDTENPDVKGYLEAIESSSSKDPRNGEIQTGYQTMMWFYTVAKAVGFENFNSKTLTEFMRKESGTHIPMAREMVNPGPTEYPQVRQPYVQIVQWKEGKIHVEEEGTEEGWVPGFELPKG